MPWRIGTCTEADRYNDDTGVLLSGPVAWQDGRRLCARFPCASACPTAARPAVVRCGADACVPQAQLLPEHYWVRPGERRPP